MSFDPDAPCGTVVESAVRVVTWNVWGRYGPELADTAGALEAVIVCGDFNAGPDSDEIRMLTGRAATAVPGMVFYDSWEMRRAPVHCELLGLRPPDQVQIPDQYGLLADLRY